jgi:hypothetical protein
VGPGTGRLAIFVKGGSPEKIVTFAFVGAWCAPATFISEKSATAVCVPPTWITSSKSIAVTYGYTIGIFGSSDDRRFIECKHIHVVAVVIAKCIVGSVGIATKDLVILVFFFIFLAETKSLLVVCGVFPERVVIIRARPKTPNSIFLFTVRGVIRLFVVVVKTVDLVPLKFSRCPANEST